MSEKDKPKWDGKSRPSNDLYKKNYDEIFKKGIIGKDTTLGDVKDFLEEVEKEKKELEERMKKVMEDYSPILEGVEVSELKRKVKQIS